MSQRTAPLPSVITRSTQVHDAMVACISRVASCILASTINISSPGPAAGCISICSGRCGARRFGAPSGRVQPRQWRGQELVNSELDSLDYVAITLYFRSSSINLSTSIQLLPDTSRPCSRLSRALRRVRSGAGAAQEGEQAQVAMKLLAQGAPAAALGCVQCPQRRQQLRCGSEGLLMHA